MTIEKKSPCKVNLLLNILGKRADGFHELETVMHPVSLFDRLTLSRAGRVVELTCSNPALPADASNLVHRAATAFLQAAKISDGVRIHLEKNIPMAAGLGGGSGNAAAALSGLNELFNGPLNGEQLHKIAAALGSDVPFFLQSKPALATGRGEKIESLEKRKPGTISKVFSTHPPTDARIVKAQQNIQVMLKERPEYVVTTSEFNDVKARLMAFHNRRKADPKDPNRPQLKKAPGSGSSPDDKSSGGDDDRPTLKRRTDTTP